jgi:[ribosomal protein S5]-alanine N-acetyltransferase
MEKLETKRLILRKPKISDWKDIIEGAGEYDVAKMTTNIPYPYKKKDAIKWINKSVKKWGNKSYLFLIELKSEKKIIGCMEIHHLDKVSNKATTGSWINKKYWKKGYITEAKIAVNDFAFNKLKLRKLNSKVFKENKASNATQRKIGYKLEGTQRKENVNPITKKIHDVNLYGLLKEDWIKSRNRLVK